MSATGDGDTLTARTFAAWAFSPPRLREWMAWRTQRSRAELANNRRRALLNTGNGGPGARCRPSGVEAVAAAALRAVAQNREQRWQCSQILGARRESSVKG